MSEIAPILLSIIICDRVIVDRRTGQYTVIGIMTTIHAHGYPAHFSQAVFFCELTNGHGKTKIVTRFVDVNEGDSVLWEHSGWLTFPDVTHVATLTTEFPGLVFPHPGPYRFQVEAAGQILGERRVVCVRVNKPTGG